MGVGDCLEGSSATALRTGGKTAGKEGTAKGELASSISFQVRSQGARSSPEIQWEHGSAWGHWRRRVCPVLEADRAETTGGGP